MLGYECECFVVSNIEFSYFKLTAALCDFDDLLAAA